MTKIIVRSLVGLFTMIYGSCAYAQDMWVSQMEMTSQAQLSTINMAINNSVLDSVSKTKRQEKNNDGYPAALKIVAPSYTPSKSLRKKNLANFVSKTRATDPAGADQMEQLFANGDIISQIDSAIAPYGLTSSNAADAYAVWWVAAWQVANSDTRDVNGATYKAVSAQAARGFATSPEFANATDAQKQEMAEAMLIQAAMIDAAKDNFAGDPAMMKQLATAVKQGAKKSGLDLDTMTLTDEGFAKAKGGKTGAAGDTGKAANPASEPVATAANDTAPAGDKTTQYALIAAAGGAGLAGMFLFGKAMGKKG
jgi:hypothetical protein